MALELLLRGETVLPSVIVSLLAGHGAAESQLPAGSSAQRRNGGESAVSPEESKKLPGLSTRQTAILEGLIGGTPNKELAHQLRLSEATVKLHVKAVLRKINVRNRTQAAVWAVRQGLEY